MGVYEERAPPTTGMHWPASSQERGSGLAVGRQGGPGSAGGPGAVEQARDLSPCLPASMGDAARPTTLPCSPPAAHHHGPHHTPHHTSHQTPLHQTHCGTNNNCYDGPTTPYDSRDYDSPGGGSEYRNNGSFDNNPSDLSMPPQGTHHHHHHHHHSHLHGQTHTQEQQTSEHLQTIPKLEPPPTPPAQSEDVPGVVCAGCGLRISDRYYLQAVDRRWHAACLQCSHCRQGLDNEVTCFCRNGNIYCKKDYYRMFGSLKRCARCQAAILSSELVMRARDLVFHVRCFSCAVCAVLLTKGDHFGMRDGTVLCRLHYEIAAATAVVPPPRQKGRPRKRKPKDLEAMTASLGELPYAYSTLSFSSSSMQHYLNADYIDMPFGRGGPGTPGIPGSNSRTKRMRTSFKHHQLRTMKSYFAINHNPDAKDLKQLSQKTGLPKRVLQVWFQNARAKWRRMVLKQEGKSDKCDSVVDGSSLGDLELYGNSGGSGGPPMSPPFMLGGPHSPASLASLDCA
ncbi:PREDICTED: LIM/homeobox protein Lhx9-like isoform X3 [Polistes canadensis]|uniref:LIM/homeobox protein Lhx9-like isoform X3 n=1 Tax=Polistes canadensis TaxID=91411 RepID=UPI000718BEF4|nr:PREDICTED: LIM/homeobox protein Lhx9-like isoform X3 [Polistes canadensis]